MAKRILNRRELRAAYDEAERRKGDDEHDEEEDEQEEEEGEGEEEERDEEEEGGEEEEEIEEGEEGEDEEERPKRKPAAKAKAKPKPKAKPKARSRSAKITRMRVIWGVFNNSHQMVASYEYPRKTEAQEHAARLTADKRSTHFVQPVKEPIEEKKEKV